jgi:hypothetical protein
LKKRASLFAVRRGQSRVRHVLNRLAKHRYGQPPTSGDVEIRHR